MYIAQSKHPSVAEQHRRLRAVETAIRNAAQLNGWKVPEARQAEFRERVEELSGGRNTVLYTAEGCPGVYVRIPADHLRGGVGSEVGQGVHEAFTVNGDRKAAFYIGKYQAAIADHSTGALLIDPNTANINARALSLPGLDPVAMIDFDKSVEYCEQNGTGFHLVTNAEWAYIYLRTLQDGFEPRGANDNAGGDYARSDETSVLPDVSGDHRRSLTGSGPVSWTHNGTPYGAWDLNGNIWGWVGGLRWVDGEVQVLPDNDAASGADHGASSTEWRAISLADGSLVAPGTANVLHVDEASGTPVLSDETLSASTDSHNVQFNALTAPGITVPDVVKRLGLYPLDTSGLQPDRGRFYIRVNAERIPRRGGGWGNTSNAGVAVLNGNVVRGIRSTSIGCRSAFVF